jgi:hypothetical protein
MAIDTANKRYSACWVGLPWRGILPFPDGTIDQADRQHIAFLYSGILASGVTPSTGDLISLKVDIRINPKYTVER